MFRKTKTKQQAVPFPGQEKLMTGHQTVLSIESRAADQIVIQTIPNTVRLAESAEFLPDVQVDTAIHGSDVIGKALGAAMSGLRVAVFSSGRGVADMTNSLTFAVNHRVPLVLHLTTRALEHQAETLLSAHDDYHLIEDTGVFQLFAANAQEAADLTLIARKVAELTLTPGVVAQDSYRTTHSLGVLLHPEPELIQRFLGNSGDIIESPTSGQQLTFGEKRRRVPAYMDPDRPVGWGVYQDRDVYLRSRAAQQVFYQQPVENVIRQVFEEYSRLTGREYVPLDAYRIADARWVFVVQGTALDSLKTFVDVMRKEQKIKVGVIGIRQWRPFPAQQLVELLNEKEAVTVLERLDVPSAADLPLMREIRSALQHYRQTHRQRKKKGWVQSLKTEDAPRLLGGVYGVGTHEPDFDHWYAALENMRDLEGKSFFYLGLTSHQRVVRYPLLERQLQLLKKHAPDLEEIYLPPKPAPATRPIRQHIILTAAGSGGSTASTMVAELLYHLTHQAILGRPEFHFYQNRPTTAYHILLPRVTQKEGSPPQVLAAEDVLLLEKGSFLENLNSGDILLISTSLTPEKFWTTIPEGIRQAIRTKKLRVFIVNSQAIARELAGEPQLVLPLAAQAMVGALCRVLPELNVFAPKVLQDSYFNLLMKRFGNHRHVVEENHHAFVKGSEALQPVEWEKLPPVEQLELAEPPAPWPVQQSAAVDESIFDLTYFYETVGFLYRRNEQHLLADSPLLAMGGLPGGSSTIRQHTVRDTVPELHPDQCTGCLQCSAICPDVALPVTIQEPATLFRTAIALAEKSAGPFLQFGRIQENYVKLAYRIIQKDDLRQFTTFKAVAEEAFRQLLELMKPADEVREALRKEFAAIEEAIPELPIVRTERFFEQFHATQKKGQVFSLVVDPDACKSCRLCATACPEGALEMVPVTEERIAGLRQQRDFLFGLPEVPLNTLNTIPEEDQEVRGLLPLLNRDVYYSIYGGDNAPAGSGGKIALHLTAAAVESEMRPRIQAFIEQLDHLIETLEKKIQGQVSGSLHINDFEAFADELSSLEKKKVDIGQLASLVVETENRPEKLDKEELELQSRTVHELKQLREKLHQGITGHGRSRLMAALEKGSIAFWSGIFPYNPLPFPWVTRENSPAVAEGLLEGIMARMVETIRIYRKGKLVADGLYEPQKHEQELQTLQYHELTDEEKALLPPVWIIGGDAMMSGNSLAALQRILHSSLPIKVLLLDNQGLGLTTGTQANTGFGSPRRHRVEIAVNALFSRKAFVAQGSVGYPSVLMEQARALVRYPGPGLLVVDAPEPVAMGITPAQVVELSRLAVVTRTMPLFTFNPRAGEGLQAALTISQNPEPESMWVTETLALPYETGKDLPLTPAHWAVRQLRYRKYFRYIPRKEWTPDLVPLLEYLELPESERKEVTPYIEILYKQQLWRVAVAPEIAADVADRAQIWQMLQELAGIRSSLVEQIRAEAQEAMEKELAVRRAALEKEFQEKQVALESQHDRIYHQKLKERLLQLSGFPQNAQKLAMKLKDLVSGNGHSEENE